MDGSDTNMLNCAIKTDLTLLLECLKYQMNCPDAQKQALLTIYSICQDKGEVIDYFREMGGVLFVYNLSKSSQHLEVKEAALFTLGGLAENNVFCQQTLCRVDIFAYMMHLLVEDCPLTLKRVVVYMVSVLVANNKSGQTYAKATGCMEVLLDLFRTSFPISSGDVRPANIAQLWQLWASVSSALCGCVNNPQNEENQLICMAIFPEAKAWLEKFELPRTEIMKPVTFLIGMIVANNPSAQESFASTGGLRTLVRSLVRFAAESCRSPLARDLAVMLTKTLSACITDKAPLASGLAEYHLVPQLLTLLSCPGLDPRNRLCVVLALGHCTESCKEHQLQLLCSGGLPHMIQLLAESQDEELKRAATFVLQTCKQMTSNLGTDGEGRSPQVDLDSPQDRAGRPSELQGYWRSAWEMQARIEQLEKLQGEGALGGVVEGERDAANSLDKRCGAAREETPPPAGRAPAGPWEGGAPPVRKARGGGGERGSACQGYKGPIESGEQERTPARPRTPPRRHVEPGEDSGGRRGLPTGSVRRQIFQASAAPQSPAPQQSARPRREEDSRSTAPPPPGGASQPSEPVVLAGTVCSVCSRMPLCLTPPATGCPGEREGAASPPPVPPESRIVFKRPHPAKERPESHNRPSLKDHMSLCSDVLEGEIRRILRTPTAEAKRASSRCSGCATGLSLLNSWSFARVLRSRRPLCDRHAALVEAGARFKRRFGNQPGFHKRERCRQINLTPIHKGSSLRAASSHLWSTAGPGWMSLTPVKKAEKPADKSAYHRDGSTSEKRQESRHGDERASSRRERKNFTQEEVQYLLDGVKRLGPCWNSVLWSYPFQKGRTNVDLAKKFTRLQKMSQEDAEGSPEA